MFSTTVIYTVFLVFSETFFTTASSELTVSRELRIQENFLVSWIVNNDTIIFNVSTEAKPGEYVGIGVSYNGAMKGADIGIAKIFPGGIISFEVSGHTHSDILAFSKSKQHTKILRIVTVSTRCHPSSTNPKIGTCSHQTLGRKAQSHFKFLVSSTRVTLLKM